MFTYSTSKITNKIHSTSGTSLVVQWLRLHAPSAGPRIRFLVYQFLVLDNAAQPQVAIDFGLDPSLVWDGYDFVDAAANTSKYVEEVMNALGDAADDRFKTE